MSFVIKLNGVKKQVFKNKRMAKKPKIKEPKTKMGES